MKTLTQDYKPQDFLIEVKYLPPTNTRDSRVKIASPYFKKSKTISWSYEYNSGVDHLAQLLIEKDIQVISRASLETKDLVLISWEDGRRFFNV